MATDFQTIDGKIYYFGKQGDETGLDEGEMAKWTIKINGKYYYFSTDGSAWLANSWLPDYHQSGNPNTWYILKKGEMDSGLKQIEGKWYYFDPNNKCRKATDFQTIDGKIYYFGKKEDGTKLVEGEMATGPQVINRKLYYFNNDGMVEE